MEIIILPFKEDTQKLSELGLKYLTFEERYLKWIKSNKKKKGLITKELFSLNYDSLLSDLKNSLFVSANTDEELNLIDSNFNVIEYVSD